MKKAPFKWLYVLPLITIVVSSELVAQRAKKNKTAPNEIVVEEVAKEKPASKGDEKVAAEEKTKAEKEEPKKEEEVQEKAGEEVVQEGTQEDTQPAKEELKEEGVEETPTEEPAEEPAAEPAEEVAAEGEEVAQEEPVQEEPAEEPAEEPQEVKEPEPEPEKVELGPDEIMGIDTVDLEDPQGNWLYKRVWWERAEAKYEKIRIAVTSVMEVRTKFFAKRAELDKTVLDPFYIKIGLSQGELQDKLTERIAKLEKDIQDKRDAQLLEKLEADKQELEQLKQEVQEVVKQDEEVENAILMLVEQANKMRNYEQQAWQDFKSIARVLDDKKARELFYKVDGAWRNIQELQRYVESNFSTGFDTLIEKVSKKVQQVDSSMQSLKEKGVDLKKPAEEEEQDEDEEEEEPPQGVLSRYIVNPITSFVKMIWSGITWPIRKIMGTTDVAPEEDEEEVVAQEEPEPTDEPAEPAAPPTVTVPTSIPAPPDIAAPTPATEPEPQEEQQTKATDEDAPETESVEVDVVEEPAADESAIAESEGEGDAAGDASVEETINIEEESEMPVFDELDTNLEELEEGLTS